MNANMNRKETTLTRMIRHTEFRDASHAAHAYASVSFIPYINDLDVLCVICDPGLPTCTGFMRPDGHVWIEFDPADLVGGV